MAFGISNEWKQSVSRGEIAFITHYWHDPRFPGIRTVTKVGCSDRQRLTDWCVANGLNPVYIHDRPPFPHFDLMGPKQKEILEKENQWEQVTRFRL